MLKEIIAPDVELKSDIIEGISISGKILVQLFCTMQGVILCRSVLKPSLPSSGVLFLYFRVFCTDNNAISDMVYFLENCLHRIFFFIVRKWSVCVNAWLINEGYFTFPKNVRHNNLKVECVKLVLFEIFVDQNKYSLNGFAQGIHQCSVLVWPQCYSSLYLIMTSLWPANQISDIWMWH